MLEEKIVKSKAHKVNMPKEIEKKCHVAIHTATTAAAAAGTFPIPMSDAVPITIAQVAMVVSLGKAFDVSLSESVAKSIINVTIAQQAGRSIFSNVLKAIPGAGTVIGGIVGGLTAAVLTEALGWIVADDFYRVSQGKEPENIAENVSELKQLFNGL
ncbi:DUF697 domain-containing protein [Blautia sp. MSJ-19]|nr:DUF697 domain-containing protein [Blautia sp. MSJ-19]